MGLGSLVGDMIDEASGTESHSTIDKFLSKFNNSAQHYVDQIDTLNTFDCTFEFWPGSGEAAAKKGFADKVLDMGKSALMDAANNATGGLAEKIVNAVSGKSIEGSRGEFKGKNNGKASFLEYLLEANLYEVSKGPNITMDLSYYIQAINTPNLNLQTGESINTPVGNFTVTGSCTTPQSNTLTMEILNTKAPLIERIFYPWMKEVSLPVWVYQSQPFTTADITISMTKHSDVKYIFVGARPITLDTYNPSQQLDGSPVRSVVFAFDYMFIDSKLENVESLKDAALGLAKGAVNDVAGMMGL